MNVEGRVYGPFSLERLRHFAAEGRLAANSQVAREGTSEWRAAGEEPDLAPLFGARPAETSPAIVTDSAPVSNPDHAANIPSANQNSESPDGKPAQFAIATHAEARLSPRFEHVLLSMGEGHRLLPNFWVLTTTHSVNTIRNRLIQELGKDDTLFVIDASRGKAAWFNFGPETDARLRRVWQRAS